MAYDEESLMSEECKQTYWTLEPIRVDKATTKKEQKVTNAFLAPTLIFCDFCVASSVAILAPFFPKEAELKGLASTEYGFVFGIAPFATLVVAPLTGCLINVVKPKVILVIGMIFLFLSTAFFGILDCIVDKYIFFALALFLRLLAGAASASVQVALFTIITSTFPDKVSMYFGFLETSYGMGCILAPGIGGFLYDLGGFAQPFYFASSISLIAVLLVICFLSTKGSKPKKVGTKFSGVLTSPLAVIYISSTVVTLSSVVFFLISTEPYLRQFGLSATLIGTVFAGVGIIYTTAAPIVGWLGDKKIANRTLSLIGCVILIISLALLGPVHLLNLPKNLGLSLFAMSLFQIGYALGLVPSFGGIVEDALSRGCNEDFTCSAASSAITSSIAFGSFVGSCLGGYLLEACGYDYSVLFFVVLELVLALVFVVYLIFSRFKQKQGEDKETGEAIHETIHRY